MFEIKTPTGWLLIRLQSEAENYFDGAPICVDADPCNMAFHALRKANGSTAAFKVNDSIEHCYVAFDDAPILESGKISYCVLRLTRTT